MSPVKRTKDSDWLVCQLGGREHYAIARALYSAGTLGSMITDFWCPPKSWASRIPALSRLHDRYHADLHQLDIRSANAGFLVEEAASRCKRLIGWDRIMHRNEWFQSFAVRQLRRLATNPGSLFSYSYVSAELLREAQRRGINTVVGQIDPGPQEERIVAQEHERYPQVKTHWRPAPKSYWDSWHEEMELCDRIMVNSAWSSECLSTEGIDKSKVEIVPLVYQSSGPSHSAEIDTVSTSGSNDRPNDPWNILFLGQINLRKGIGRLIEAMKLLEDDARFRLTMVGPSEVDSQLWKGSANVRWLGPLRRSQVDQAYQSADVFMLPTLSDGYALTQLEAIGNGLPVIASRHCGEAVDDGKNGLILADLEPSTIAEAIVKSREMEFRIEPQSSFGLEDLAKRLNGIRRQMIDRAAKVPEHHG